jgi:hypothetical protein
MSGKVLSREEIKKAVEKAWKDESFKRELTAKPHKALSQLGVSVPEKIEIKVLEESAGVLYLVLPVNPEELTDQSLDSVAGGVNCKTMNCLHYDPDRNFGY